MSDLFTNTSILIWNTDSIDELIELHFRLTCTFDYSILRDDMIKCLIEEISCKMFLLKNEIVFCANGK